MEQSIASGAAALQPVAPGLASAIGNRELAAGGVVPASVGQLDLRRAFEAEDGEIAVCTRGRLHRPGVGAGDGGDDCRDSVWNEQGDRVRPLRRRQLVARRKRAAACGS
jgi:hypothetical protein